MNEQARGQLLDLIYESILHPDLWVAVMERLTDEMGGNRAWISQLSAYDGNGAGLIARIDPTMPPLFIKHFYSVNPYTRKADPAGYLAKFRPGVVDGNALLDERALVRSEFYNDFMRPQDVHGTLLIDLARRGDDTVTMNIMHSRSKPLRHGSVALAESLLGDLARAFKLSQTFSTMRSLGESGAALLDHSADAIFVLDSLGLVRHINTAAEQLIGRRIGLDVSAGQLSASRADTQSKIDSVIGRATSADISVRTGGTLMFRSGNRTFLLTAMPLHGDGLPIVTSGPSVLVQLVDLQRELRIRGDVMHALYGLTPAETKLVQLLLDGITTSGAAISLGVQLSTVRAHLKSIFHKTGTNGQADLSRLAMRITASGTT